jgi:uncharacterized membrane protein
MGSRWGGRASLTYVAQAHDAMTVLHQPGRNVPGPPVGTLPWLRWWPFIVLAGAGIVVFLTGGRGTPLTGALTRVWLLTLAIMLAMAVFLEWAARMCTSRQRLAPGFDASPEAARVILDATAGLTRVVNLAIAIYIALLVTPHGWLPGLGTGQTLGFGMVVIVGAIVWAVWALKSVQRYLDRTGQLGGLEGWNGFIYSNAKDPRTWVPKLSGLGATLNFAHARAWLILGAILVLPIGGLVGALVAGLCR